MRKEVVLRLRTKVREIIRGYSDPERDCNYNKESFLLETKEDIHIIDDYDAAVVLKKNTGKYALFVFIYIPAKDYWWYYVPTSSHNLSAELQKLYVEVHRRNGRIEWMEE